ncbi:MAG: hypothetical protein JJU02_02795 [Cryomorphaceae bacterium]|nr:hypothetical protein [Cryomorphaceae bacterium]
MKNLTIYCLVVMCFTATAQHNALNGPKWGITLETGLQANFAKLDGAALATPVRITGEYIKPLKRNSSYSIGFSYAIAELKVYNFYNPDIRPLIPPFVNYNMGDGNMFSTIAIPVTYAYHAGRFTRLEIGGILSYDIPHEGYKVVLSTKEQTTIPQLFFRTGFRTFLKRKLTLGIHITGSLTPSEYYGGNSEHYLYGPIPRWDGFRSELMFSLTRLF